MSPPPTPQWARLASALHVWYVGPESLGTEAMERRWMGRLSPAERERHGLLRVGELRHVYLVTRALCRAVLSRYVGVGPGQWVFTENGYGKPAVAGPAGLESLRFNLTHSPGLVACAVTRAGDVGVDVEETTRAPGHDEAGRMAAHFLSPAEAASLTALPPGLRADRFREYWVVKEAYLKGVGTGLSCPTESFTIEWGDGGQPLAIGDWRLALHRPTPRHVAATAVRAGGAPVPVTWRPFEGLAGDEEDEATR